MLFVIGGMFRIIRCTKRCFVLNRYYCNSLQQNNDVKRLRTLGLLAHIDAGKTTTTERMLFYSGSIKHMGEVHHGNTVTDFMEQERERGITITSAAVTFFWKQYQLNLIDTPGHIDFTMEVEQCLRVLDGAIVILDGSAGVEAQTITVWRQLDRFNIPRIIFANKMDRPDANLVRCCTSIEEKLGNIAVPIQQAIIRNKVLVGVIDLITLTSFVYEGSSNKMNQCAVEGELLDSAKSARANLVDVLTNHNEKFADYVISLDSIEEVGHTELAIALRQCTLDQKIVPVLVGSAYKNIGIEPLLDATVAFLPSPLDRQWTRRIAGSMEGHLCARVFKIKHDRHRGPLTFLRLYAGALTKNQRFFNISQQRSEQVGRIYHAFADEFKEVNACQSDNIAVVSGLKDALSGDLITSSSAVYQRSRIRNPDLFAATSNDDTTPAGPEFLLTPPPPAVFLCSIEAPSLSQQAPLELALRELQREDPSLRVHNDSETGQTILGGMGELHLEIIKDRILKEYKVDAELGPVHIAYKEQSLLEEPITDTAIVDSRIGKSRQALTIKMSLVPIKDNKKDSLLLDKHAESASNIAAIYPKHLLAIRQGVEVALGSGPKIGAPLINTTFMLHWFEVVRGTSESVICATTTQLAQKLLKSTDSCILEPIMNVEIVTLEEHLSVILADLNRRRATINSIDHRGINKVLSAFVPLNELMGYSTMLRTMSSGMATFSMEFNHHKIMSSSEEDMALRQVRGF